MIDPTSPLGDTLRELIEDLRCGSYGERHYTSQADCERFADELAALVRAVPLGVEEVQITMRQSHPIWGRLGIGAEAWVELGDVERQGLAHRNIDSSGVSLGWRTFKTVMNALRHCGETHYALPPAPVEPAARAGAQEPIVDGVFDNRSTMQREEYCNGVLVRSVTARTIGSFGIFPDVQRSPSPGVEPAAPREAVDLNVVRELIEDIYGCHRARDSHDSDWENGRDVPCDWCETAAIVLAALPPATCGAASQEPK